MTDNVLIAQNTKDQDRAEFEAWKKSLPPGKGYNAFEAWQGGRDHYAPKLTEAEAVEKCAVAVKQIFDLSLVGPDSGFKAEDIAKAVLAAAGARFAQPATLLYGGPAGGGMSCTPIQKNSPTAQDDKHD